MSINRAGPSWFGRPATRIAVVAALVLVILGALAVASCGGDGGTVEWPSPTATPGPPTPTPSIAASATPEPPAELRVAFINLYSPLTLDADNATAGQTFEERLRLIAQELKAFDPDVVGFNEASVTKAYGNATAYLQKELKMEPVYARANPWFLGQSKDESDQLAKQVGFEEGELLLVRADRWPLLGDVESIVLNPRTSESGERRVALHLVLKAPEPAGRVDVYLTHLTGGGDRVRSQQVQFLANWIVTTRGEGPVLILGDFSELPDSAVFDPLVRLAFVDVAKSLAGGTCCRESVIQEQEPLATRTDYIFAHGWTPASVEMFADKPGKRADGTPLYASDHNGLFAVFALQQLVFPGVGN